jgi:hypothetical protein
MKKVLKNCDIVVNGQNISNYCREVTVETERDEVDVTGFQAANKETLAGLGDATITLDVFQDYALAAIDALLWPLSQSDTPFTVAVKPDSGAVSTSNPLYSMQGLLFAYSPIAAAVGEAASTTVPIRNAMPAGLTRATA